MNTEDRFEFSGRDGTKISAYHWSAGDPPRALLLTAHGMGEHAKRYQAGLAEVIASGIDVYAPDHRGHGTTAPKPESFGDFGPGGFPAVVDDLAVLARKLRDDNPGLPLILLGHSMGSFASQLFVLDHADLIDGLALSGSASLDRLAAAAMDPALLANLNAAFEPARTPFDWLSRDPDQVDAYINDPACGFPLTPESFGSLFACASRLCDADEIQKIPDDLAIYIFSGLEDPLAAAFDGLTPLIERYKDAGVLVKTDLYPGARHEVLNETNRKEVVANFGKWIDGVIE
ncbi:alpha/beta fold hydrolase [Hyphococcus sp.]|uniref:alpha/beta fold hydrolase n=1 Tax=Hyphococcus sp. TaxID=2038636 RepID=UPI0035C72034